MYYIFKILVPFIVFVCDFSGIIFSSSMSYPKRSQVVYKADHVIDDLVIDPAGAYLYWTAYRAGLIARLDITGHSNTTHDVIVSSLTSPRALVIDVINRCVTSHACHMSVSIFQYSLYICHVYKQ